MEKDDTITGGEAQDTIDGGQETVDGGEAQETVEGGQETQSGAEDTAGKDTPTGAAAEDVIVQIGDEKPEEHEKAPQWVRDLRTRNRELEKENRTLRQQQAKPGEAPKLGPKPKLEDFDYDAEKFEPALSKWFEDKRKVDDEEAKVAEREKKAEDEWKGKLDAYGQAANALKAQFKNYDEAEGLVKDTLSDRQQAVIVKYSKNPALVIAALGMNPEKLKELSAVGDLVEFAIAVHNLEGQLKVTKKTPPAPEKKVEGTGAKAGVNDSTLDRLRAEAAKTGDYTKVSAYKRSKASAKAA